MQTRELKRLHEALTFVLRKRLDVKEVTREVIERLQEETKSVSRKPPPKETAKVSKERILYKIQQANRKMPVYYNLDRHCVHGASPSMRKKYPEVVFVAHDPILRVCGRAETLQSYASILQPSAERGATSSSSEDEADLFSLVEGTLQNMFEKR